MLLSKGFEVEMFTGTPAGEIVGLSDRIVAALNGFVREPDSRNVEYTTPPLCQYEKLLCELVRPRHELRKYLRTLGHYTLVPGSTLSLGDTDHFYRSDPSNPYHAYIEQTYGTTVVTASVHINIGIADPEVLMRACRLVRVEAALYLALTAASPFLDGAATGYHSSRWQVFPKTPTYVPLFESHAHHIRWMEAQLAAGAMQNVRHLWSAVRPNGDRRPYNLNRLELRICDLISDPIALLAVTAILESRLIQLIQEPELDPLIQSTLPEASRNHDLVQLSDANEMAVAKHSLDAELRHWQDGRPILAREWIQQLYDDVWPVAKHNGISCFLSPLKKILREGNEAQRWQQQYEAGQSVQAVMVDAIHQVSIHEDRLAQELCEPCVA
ncbi:MAG: glutamate--cysteine ligase [Leptolyngbyaceae cyanobacterium SM2_5_2]|nr:glutamate--cysteine ligase [Leptolyngbyaceae cyanobacterium SM2_5_2]